MRNQVFTARVLKCQWSSWKQQNCEKKKMTGYVLLSLHQKNQKLILNQNTSTRECNSFFKPNLNYEKFMQTSQNTTLQNNFLSNVSTLKILLKYYFPVFDMNVMTRPVSRTPAYIQDGVLCNNCQRLLAVDYCCKALQPQYLPQSWVRLWMGYPCFKNIATT